MSLEGYLYGAQKAFENDEVFDLLMGNGIYHYETRFSISVKTDIIAVMDFGVYPYYKSASEAEKVLILEKLITAYRKMMLSSDPETIWWAYACICGEKYSELRKQSPYKIADALLLEIEPILTEKQSALETSDSKYCSGFPNSLWGDILRYKMLLPQWEERYSGK